MSSSYHLREVVEGLRAGDFSRMEPAFTGAAETPCDLERWCADGSLEQHPGTMAEALTCACFLGRTSVAEQLLDHGADPTAGNATGLDALHWAVNRGQVETVRMLLDRKVPLDTRNMYGGTILGTAIWSAINEPRDGHAAIVEMLLDAGAPCDPALHPCGESAIDALLQRHLGKRMPRRAAPDA